MHTKIDIPGTSSSQLITGHQQLLPKRCKVGSSNSTITRFKLVEADIKHTPHGGFQDIALYDHIMIQHKLYGNKETGSYNCSDGAVVHKWQAKSQSGSS